MWQVVEQWKREVILSVFNLEKHKTDTAIFRLHYKLSVWLVVLYSLGYCLVQFAGGPISCYVSNKGILSETDLAHKAINDYCWVHGSYVITSPGRNRKDEELSVGVRGITGEHEKIFYHQYYKWMYFHMAWMLILLYVPRQMWRCIEGGRLKSLVKNLSIKMIFLKKEDIAKEEGKLADYLFTHLGYNQGYALGFILCEFLNVVVVASLLYTWNLISDNQLLSYGWSSFGFLGKSPTERNDTLVKVFPVLSKCTFNTYGPSGNIVPHDAMCIMPLNVVNEKAAVFFWCYFTILGVLGASEVLFRIILMLSKRLRLSFIARDLPLTDPGDINLIMGGCSYCDWFIFSQLTHSLDIISYQKVLLALADKLRSKDNRVQTV